MRKIISLLIVVTLIVSMLPVSLADETSNEPAQKIRGYYVHPTLDTNGYPYWCIGPEEYANQGGMSGIYLPTGVAQIWDRAFANSVSLKCVIIPETVNYIADNAFEDSPDVHIIAPKGSFAVSYARGHGMAYTQLNGSCLLDADPRDLATMLFLTDYYSYHEYFETHDIRNIYWSHVSWTSTARAALSDSLGIIWSKITNINKSGNGHQVEYERKALSAILNRMNYSGQHSLLNVLCDEMEKLQEITEKFNDATQVSGSNFSNDLVYGWLDGLFSVDDPFAKGLYSNKNTIIEKADTVEKLLTLCLYLRYLAGEYSYSVTVLEALQEAISDTERDALHTSVDDLLSQYRKEAWGMVTKALDLIDWNGLEFALSNMGELSYELLVKGNIGNEVLAGVLKSASNVFSVVTFTLEFFKFVMVVTGQKSVYENEMNYMVLIDILGSTQTSLNRLVSKKNWTQDQMHKADILISFFNASELEMLDTLAVLCKKYPDELRDVKLHRAYYMSHPDPVGAIAAQLGGVVDYDPADIEEEQYEDCELQSGEYTINAYSNGTAQITKYDGEAEEVSIPSVLDGYTVTSIGDQAFSSCSGLTSVTIPDSVTSIGANPFVGCSSLAQVNVSSKHPSLATIQGVLFSKSDKRLVWYPMTFTASSYSIPQGIRIIGDYAFADCDSLTSVMIPDSVTTIGNYAFACCDNLTSVTVPDFVTFIGEYAFYYCSGLTSVSLPDSVTSIGDYTFYRCRSLTSITIPDSATSIGNYAFCECSNLISVTISDSVTSIGDDAFYWCGSLTNITIPDSVTSIGNEAFHRCLSLTTLTIPDSVTSIGTTNPFISCESLTQVNVSADHPSLTIIDGVLFDKQEWRLVWYPIAFTDSSYSIPQGVKIIGDDAFAGCNNLTSVTIPDSMISIGDYAFRWCISLTSVAIPDSVTSIGDGAFYSCSSLAGVSIPNSITSIGKGVFSECDSLTSLTIPDSVTSIGDGAFYGCDNLSSCKIPASVISIGEGAFRSNHVGKVRDPSLGIKIIFQPISATIIIERGSYTEQYCIDNDLKYTYTDTLDWLNN